LLIVFGYTVPRSVDYFENTLID